MRPVIAIATRTLIILMAAALSLTSAFCEENSVDAILSANRVASGGPSWPQQGTLTLRYHYEGQGLTGETSSVFDLRTGAYIDRYKIGPTHGADGFDGAQDWMEDLSGAVTPESGGDKRDLAVSEAYRDAQSWWRADRGGASIVRAASKNLDGRSCDVLTVTPKGGKTFDAWFDSSSHLLSRIVEMEGFLLITTTFSDYQPTNGVLLPYKIVVDVGGDASSLQTQTLSEAKFAPAQPLSAYARQASVPNDHFIEGGANQATVPFQLLNNHIYVHVSINGKGPLLFIVDTGGHDIVMPHAAKALGLHAEGEVPSHGAGRNAEPSGFVPVAEIKVGGVVLKNQVVNVLKFQPAETEGFNVDGMIGFEVFRRFVTEIDYTRGTITFIQPEAFRPPADATPVPFIFYSHVPEVEGSFEGLPGKFDIDTGSRVELSLTKPFAERNGLREKHPKGVVAVDGWGVGGPVKSYVTRASGLKLGSVAIPNVVTSLAIQDKGSFSDPTYDGNVGDKLLKRFAITFDYFGQVMYLKPRPGQVADADTFDRSGMWINSAADGFEITDVTPGGPASTAGLKVGDHIVAVNGAAADSHKLSDFREEVRTSAAGTVLRLTIKRGSATSTVDLTLRDQI